MAELDTAELRRKLKTERFALSAAVQAAARNELIRELPPLLNELDRLRAENQRLREYLASGGDEQAKLTLRYNDLEEEVTDVLQLMDGLAEQRGDEGVFRRCRDRLRAAVESTGGGDG